MKASIFYRIAAVVLLLFALGHTIGFRGNVPEWNAGSVIAAMKATHFNAQGFDRTYWDFFSAFGFLFTVFLLFAAVLAWQLAALPPEVASRTRGITWSLAVSFAAITILSWKYVFTTPLIFSMVVTVCLIAAAFLSSKQKA
jgi:hypothetical protein